MKQLRNNPTATFSDISDLNANKNVPWRSQAGLVILNKYPFYLSPSGPVTSVAPDRIWTSLPMLGDSHWPHCQPQSPRPFPAGKSAASAWLARWPGYIVHQVCLERSTLFRIASKARFTCLPPKFGNWFTNLPTAFCTELGKFGLPGGTMCVHAFRCIYLSLLNLHRMMILVMISLHLRKAKVNSKRQAASGKSHDGCTRLVFPP